MNFYRGLIARDTRKYKPRVRRYTRRSALNYLMRAALKTFASRPESLHTDTPLNFQISRNRICRRSPVSHCSLWRRQFPILFLILLFDVRDLTVLIAVRIGGRGVVETFGGRELDARRNVAMCVKK